ncbi:MAG: hypothetical protein ABSE69_01640 [Roseiarcus sp.]|jgi:hypothetical protein
MQMNLDQAATVLWTRHQDMSNTNVTGGSQRQFDSLRNAVRFVMEELPDVEKGTAFVQTIDRSCPIAEIQEIYARADFRIP